MHKRKGSSLNAKLLPHYGPAPTEAGSTKSRARHIIKNSIPNTITYFCFHLSTTVCFSILSAHSYNSPDSTELLAACGIGASLLVSAYYSVFYSLNSAVLNLASQAYGGEKYTLVGYILHRALIINISLMIPLAFLISKGESLLLLVGLNQQVSSLSIKYAMDMLPATSFAVIFNTLHYYLIAQEVLFPQVISLGSCVTIQYFLSYFLIGCGMDYYKAVVYSKTIIEIANVVAIIIYISRQPILARTWFRPRRKSFRKLSLQLKAGVEGGSITYFEVLVMETITFVSGMMDSSQVAAQAAFLNFTYVIAAAPVGIGNTVAALVSEKIGEGSKEKALGYIRTGIGIILTLSVVTIIGVECFSDSIVQVYTNDRDVAPALKVLMIFYPCFGFFDFLLQITSGLLRALGLEKLASGSYFGVYYFISLPTAYVLGIVCELGALGLWIGIALGAAILSLMGVFTIFVKIDIEKQIEIIQKRLEQLEEHLPTYAPSVAIEMQEIEKPEENDY